MRYPVVLPDRRDPRLHLAAVITALQVLGQTVLGFEVSVAQILLSVAVCVLIEVPVTMVRQGAIIWPASAIMTGNSVGFILRVNGTRHGDWWSLDGAWIFMLAAALSLLSKYVVRFRGRHIFNPSNLGLLVVFLVLGTTRTNPQDLWWGPMSWGLGLTLAVIVGGGLITVRRLHLLSIVVPFVLGLAVFMSVVAATGHCMSARWHFGPVCGTDYWSALVVSPEILAFTFFMITDPRTAPSGQVARAVYGVGVALVAALLVAPQQTEFGTKVAILGALTLVCATRPLMERWLPAAGSARDRLAVWAGVVPDHGQRLSPGALRRNLLVAAGQGAVLLGAASALIIFATLPSLSAAPPAADKLTVATPRSGIADRIPLPTATVAADVGAAGASLTSAAAQSLAQDVADDLVIDAEAVRVLDPQMAATACTGSALDALRRVISAAYARHRRSVPAYVIQSATIVLARDPATPQAAPQLGVELRGTVTTIVYDDSLNVISRSTQAYHRVLAARRPGDHYLISADTAPPG